MGGKGRRSIEDVEHHHTSSYCAKYALLGNEEQGMKFWFRDAAPCFFAPLLCTQPRIEGKKTSLGAVSPVAGVGGGR